MMQGWSRDFKIVISCLAVSFFVLVTFFMAKLLRAPFLARYTSPKWPDPRCFSIVYWLAEPVILGRNSGRCTPWRGPWSLIGVRFDKELRLGEGSTVQAVDRPHRPGWWMLRRTVAAPITHTSWPTRPTSTTHCDRMKKDKMGRWVGGGWKLVAGGPLSTLPVWAGQSAYSCHHRALPHPGNRDLLSQTWSGTY